MKRCMTALLALVLILSCAATASAADSNVTYDGNSQSFFFQPGSDASLTDLFPNFKGVMPGDSLTQTITVRNDQNDKVKVEIFLRSLGAQEGSEEFLSQLMLKVKLSDENTMGYMFDAYANESAQLSDWVCLGMPYSGGEVNLDVILDVPVTMGNEFQNQIGYLDWEFMVVEYPVEPDDPTPPPTGDMTEPALLLVLMAVSAAVILLLLWCKREQGRGRG